MYTLHFAHGSAIASADQEVTSYLRTVCLRCARARPARIPYYNNYYYYYNYDNIIIVRALHTALHYRVQAPPTNLCTHLHTIDCTRTSSSPHDTVRILDISSGRTGYRTSKETQRNSRKKKKNGKELLRRTIQVSQQKNQRSSTPKLFKSSAINKLREIMSDQAATTGPTCVCRKSPSVHT